MLEAMFWRQFLPRVSVSVGGSRNDVTLRAPNGGFSDF
jgi:hypothetical protein